MVSALLLPKDRSHSVLADVRDPFRAHPVFQVHERLCSLTPGLLPLPAAGQEVSSWGEAVSQKSIHRAPSTSGHESRPGTHTGDGRHGAERGNSAHRVLGPWDLVTEVGSLQLRKPCPDLGSGPPPPGPAREPLLMEKLCSSHLLQDVWLGRSTPGLTRGGDQAGRLGQEEGAA